MIRKFIVAAAWAGSLFAMSGSGARAAEIGYERVGRWNVVAVMAGNRFGYCAADIDNGNMTLRIGTDGRNWQFGIPYDGGQREVEFYVGFDIASEVFTFRAEGDGWASTEMFDGQIDAFRQSPEFRINPDGEEQVWRLKGSSAAIDAAAECARNRGRAPEPEMAPDDESMSGGGDNPLDMLAQGFSGVASKNGQSWPYKVRQVRMTGPNSFTASIAWTNLGAVHQIKGVLKNSTLFFKETAYIKRGNALLGCEYTVPFRPAPVMKGSYAKCINGAAGKGSVTVKLPQG